MKRYIIRAVKYFFQLCILLFVFVTLLVALKFVPKDVSQIFVNGYDSLWQIALIVAAFSAVYPRFGYGDREISVPGDPSGLDSKVVSYMEAHGYKEIAPMEFKLSNGLLRILHIFEDKVIITHSLGGYVISGRTKDILKIAAGLQALFQE